MSEQNEFPASVLVLTVKGPVPMCLNHAEKYNAIMGAMGSFPANIMNAPKGSVCSNCQNERKKDQ